MLVKHLDHLNLYVNDLAETERFYADLFGFERVEGGVQGSTPWAILKAGDAMLAVYEQPSLPKNRPGMNHFALRITDREAWLAAVERTGTSIRYGGAIRWNHSTSWYLSDPSGYEIEVALWADDHVAFG